MDHYSGSCWLSHMFINYSGVDGRNHIPVLIPIDPVSFEYSVEMGLTTSASTLDQSALPPSMMPTPSIIPSSQWTCGMDTSSAEATFGSDHRSLYWDNTNKASWRQGGDLESISSLPNISGPHLNSPRQFNGLPSVKSHGEFPRN